MRNPLTIFCVMFPSLPPTLHEADMPAANLEKNPQYLLLLAQWEEARRGFTEAYLRLDAALDKFRAWGPADFEKAKGTAGFDEHLAVVWARLYRIDEEGVSFKKAQDALEELGAAYQEPDAQPGVRGD